MRVKACSVVATAVILIVVLLEQSLIGDCQRHAYFSQPVHPIEYPVPAAVHHAHHHLDYTPRPHVDYATEYARCLEKVCEQTITGRGLPYSQILHIIHSGSYLNAIHLDKKQPNVSDHYVHNRHKRTSHAANAASEVFGHGIHLNTPILLPMGMVVLSMMFLASLAKNNKKPAEPEPTFVHVVESVEEPTTTIIEHHPAIEVFEGPPLIPYDVPNPGQPGGGYEPDVDEHTKLLGLVPYGLIPLAVFPNLMRDGNPSECVIFAEPDPIIVAPPPPLPPYYSYDPYLRLRSKKLGERKLSKRAVRKKKYNGRKRQPKSESSSSAFKAVPSRKAQKMAAAAAAKLLKTARHQHFTEFDRLYGFRCLVTIIDRKACTTFKECKDIKDHEAQFGQGYFFQPSAPFQSAPQAFSHHLYPPLFHTHFNNKRYSLPYAPAPGDPEFYADELPQCRIQENMSYSLECEGERV